MFLSLKWPELMQGLMVIELYDVHLLFEDSFDKRQSDAKRRGVPGHAG